MGRKIDAQEALNYHSKGKAGKIEVISTKNTKSQRDLSLTYTPGVAFPCKAIQKDKNDAYKYTSKGNLVAVVTNGTAVLGLGALGPEPGNPEREGKGGRLKFLAIMVFFAYDSNTKDPHKLIE